MPVTAVSIHCTPRYQCMYSCLYELYTKIPMPITLSVQVVYQRPLQLSLYFAHQDTRASCLYRLHTKISVTVTAVSTSCTQKYQCLFSCVYRLCNKIPVPVTAVSASCTLRYQCLYSFLYRLYLAELVSSLVLWAQSTARGYIRVVPCQYRCVHRLIWCIPRCTCLCNV